MNQCQTHRVQPLHTSRRCPSQTLQVWVLVGKVGGPCEPLWGASYKGKFGGDHLSRQGLGLQQAGDKEHTDLGLFWRGLCLADESQISEGQAM